MPLEQELKIYEREKEQLLSEAEGKFVLIKGDKIIGIYTDEEDALTAGYQKIGNQEFLIKEIVRVEPVNFFTRPIVSA